MKKYIPIILISLFFTNANGQGFFYNLKLNRAMKLNESFEQLSNTKAKMVFGKLKKTPDKSNVNSSFKYIYLEESFDKFNNRKNLYPEDVTIDSLRNGLKSIENILFLRKDESLDQKKISKLGLRERKLEVIYDFFLKRINIYEDSIQQMHIEDSIAQFNDSIVLFEKGLERVLFETTNNPMLEMNDFFKKMSKSALVEELGEAGKTVDVYVKSYQDGTNKIYRFRMKYDATSFDPGAYKGPQTDYVLKGMFHVLRGEIRDFDFKMKITGEADATDPNEVYYHEGSNEWGDLTNVKIHLGDENEDTKPVSIRKGEEINNFEIAFLRAYNAKILFEEIVGEEITLMSGIDHLVVDRENTGDDFRVVSFVLIINNYFAEKFNELDLKGVKTHRVRGVRTVEFTIKDGDVELEQYFEDER